MDGIVLPLASKLHGKEYYTSIYISMRKCLEEFEGLDFYPEIITKPIELDLCEYKYLVLVHLTGGTSGLAKQIVLKNFQINSYKKLPIVVYQIQIKFRDELRARGGVIRAREFLMKDAYSFCQNEAESKMIYERMKEAYRRIFSRFLLDYRLVEADTGPIGGKSSHEFIILTDSGEDRIVECEKCGYVAKLDKAISIPDEAEKNGPQAVKEVSTPGIGLSLIHI